MVYKVSKMQAAILLLYRQSEHFKYIAILDEID